MVLPNELFVATYHTLWGFDHQLRPTRKITHRNFAGIHELKLVEDGIWVSSTPLGALAEGLTSGAERLTPGGRLVVIAYHSLEDRLVKTRIRELERGCLCPPELPECRCGLRPVLRRVTRKAVRPTPEELGRNPRARSARLRAAERLAS